MMACVCCCSVELIRLQQAATSLNDVIQTDAPFGTVLQPAQQRAVIAKLNTVLAALPQMNFHTVAFQNVNNNDVTVRMNRWSQLAQDLKDVVVLIEARLAGAPFKMADLCNDIKTIILEITTVVHRATVRLLAH